MKILNIVLSIKDLLKSILRKKGHICAYVFSVVIISYVFVVQDDWKVWLVFSEILLSILISLLIMCSDFNEILMILKRPNNLSRGITTKAHVEVYQKVIDYQKIIVYLITLCAFGSLVYLGVIFEPGVDDITLAVKTFVSMLLAVLCVLVFGKFPVDIACMHLKILQNKKDRQAIADSEKTVLLYEDYGVKDVSDS